VRPAGHRAALTAFLSTILLGLLLTAPGMAAAAKPSFTATGIQSEFDWNARDYVLRSCEGGARQVSVTGAKGWKSSVDGAEAKGGSYAAPFTKQADEGLTVKFTKKGKKQQKRASFHLRCLPADFPLYAFDRVGNRTGGPDMFSMQMGGDYGAIIDSNGTPVYWLEADGHPDNFTVLQDGTLTWSPVDQILLQVGPLEVRTLQNELIHRFTGSPGTTADVHEMLLLPNGNYLFGAQHIFQADTTAFGGSADSDVIGIEVQEWTPQEKEVWSWSSEDKIGLEETGRWWDSPILDTEPYDATHWNAVEPDGKNFMLISMRHTDALYKIDKRSGEIVWKLGGTPTDDSLKVLDDPKADYPFGGQHDVRLDGDDLTVFDNQTNMEDPQPRALRYKIDEKKGTATLVEEIKDKGAQFSACCGSARRFDDGSWLVGFGGNPDAGIAAFNAQGKRIYRFTLNAGFSYRAQPVPEGSVSKKDLRGAMNQMAAAPSP